MKSGGIANIFTADGVAASRRRARGGLRLAIALGLGGACLVTSMAPALAADPAFKACAEFPAFKGTFQTVADSVDFNGLPLSVQRFDSALAPEQVLAFYRSAWAPPPRQPGPVESENAGWKIIAMMRGDCFYTVQVKPGGISGSTGFLGLSTPPGKGAVKAEIPSMTGTTILNDVTHNDAGKTARTVMLTNGFSPAANATFYQNAYTGRGWKMMSNQEMGTRTGRANVMVFKNGARELSVTSMRDGGDTHVLLNFVDQP